MTQRQMWDNIDICARWFGLSQWEAVKLFGGALDWDTRAW